MRWEASEREREKGKHNTVNNNKHAQGSSLRRAGERGMVDGGMWVSASQRVAEVTPGRLQHPEPRQELTGRWET